MLYDAYQAQSDLLAPVRAWAGLTSSLFRETCAGPTSNYIFKSISAAAEIVNRAQLIHDRPDYGIDTVTCEGRVVPVREEAALTTPFGTLLRFAKETNVEQPRVLIVAPMAGHFATLLRNTAKTMLSEHDVYITDWHNARDVPLSAGRFGLDEYIDHVIRFFEHIGPGAHVVAVCQPCAALLATVAVMAQSDHPCQPRSMTLMAGPVDTRINPTAVNELATGHPIEWFEKNLITPVPRRYAGAHRRVYPGFVQVSAFLSMNLPRHVRAHLDLFEHIRKGEDAKAEANRKFYDEYFSVADLPAEFYLETVRRVFQEFHLPRGLFTHRDRRVEPAAIRKTALLTVEGERDDICSVGQTLAAHDLCVSIKPFRKKHYVQAGVGHYGVFSGTRWQTQIYPIVRNMILANN
ncbi:MAG: polyhydroxyalkanoate depolymerase [Alphaproteobacteria bacterium]|nr:polyhydroxyalkanoate depolymerase [Alphaproteobacteria bacterium]MBL7098528.1 polyhydroxyalkanoate depolymerase [Alphaproteobacteria bacterium]